MIFNVSNRIKVCDYYFTPRGKKIEKSFNIVSGTDSSFSYLFFNKKYLERDVCLPNENLTAAFYSFQIKKIPLSLFFPFSLPVFLFINNQLIYFPNFFSTDK